jgi:long-chain acyl-CoA synthetase
VDRKKDMISVSGNKVYPNEVEAVIVNLDGVLDVAVVGRASQKSGEEVVAFVSKDVRTELSEEEIVVFCKNQLARFKVPKAVFFLDELPKTPIGKTARKVLRERLINESWR